MNTHDILYECTLLATNSFLDEVIGVRAFIFILTAIKHQVSLSELTAGKLLSLQSRCGLKCTEFAPWFQYKCTPTSSCTLFVTFAGLLLAGCDSNSVYQTVSPGGGAAASSPGAAKHLREAHQLRSRQMRRSAEYPSRLCHRRQYLTDGQFNRTDGIMMLSVSNNLDNTIIGKR